MIDEFIKQHGNECEYNPLDTLIYTLNKKQTEEIKNEYKFRKANNFDVTLFNKKNNPFNFDFECGLFARGGGADLNPYLFTKQLINESVKMGAKVYEHTKAVKINYGKNAEIITDKNFKITSEYIVCSTGYNTSLFTKKRFYDKYLTYSVVTSPISDFQWYKRTLLQDKLKHYHYIKLTNDNRIVIGGEDVRMFINYFCKIQSEIKYKKLEIIFTKYSPI